MAADVSLYEGRSQSFIKHEFLTAYLQAAAFKILQGTSKTFNFVDAFAGPWRTSDRDDYSDASFHQAIRTLNSVKDYLEKQGIVGLKIRFCFCERDSVRFRDLSQYSSTVQDVEIYLFEGNFEDHLEEIGAVCADGFTFTFVDPTGWNIRSDEVLRFLMQQQGEFLLNFMAEHINRHATFAGVSASLGRFLSDPNWAEEFAKLPSDMSNEMRILALLREKIRIVGAARYVPHCPIKKHDEERVKMRLILGTNSIRGVEVFRDVQSKVEKMEMAVRLPKTGQANLFGDDALVEMDQSAFGVGSLRNLNEARLLINAHLSRVGTAYIDQFAAIVMEEIPIRKTQIKSLLNTMRAAGEIAFELPPRCRVVQPTTEIVHVRLKSA